MSTEPNTPVIRCDSVYKIFGDNAKRMMRETGGVVDAEKFEQAGCIVGVNNASFEVYPGCLLYTSPSPRDATLSRMPSSA